MIHKGKALFFFTPPTWATDVNRWHQNVGGTSVIIHCFTFSSDFCGALEPMACKGATRWFPSWWNLHHVFDHLGAVPCSRLLSPPCCLPHPHVMQPTSSPGYPVTSMTLLLKKVLLSSYYFVHIVRVCTIVLYDIIIDSS